MSAAVWLRAVAYAAPGMPDWETAREILRGAAPWRREELPPYQPQLLPANERRRASGSVRLAFRVAEAATAFCAEDGAPGRDQLATVFSSADGDLAIAQRICMALATRERMVSPTDFHNSVHNAAAGYWSIACGARGPASAIAGGDASFAAGLLEAVAMAAAELRNTLLVCCDLPAPEPLLQCRRLNAAVGVALVLTPEPLPGSLAKLSLQLLAPNSAVTDAPDAGSGETGMQDAAAEAERLGNPAARVLPLLHSLACGAAGRVMLAAPGGSVLAVGLSPCLAGAA